MPTYEYECKTCGYRFEKFQNMSDEPLKKCPKCGNNVKRIIGRGMGVIFKGSGFYATDYKKNSFSGGVSRPGRNKGKTCCGREERCDSPPCSDDGVCKR